MNEMMIENHNKVVKDNDHVYFLGDIAMGSKNVAAIVSRCKGRKRLILGNHDGVEKKDFEVYFQFFEKIMVSRRMGNLLFTHYPVYLGTEHKVAANVHGHIHEKELDDPRYFNISVERINYTPISLEEIQQILAKRGIEIDAKL